MKERACVSHHKTSRFHTVGAIAALALTAGLSSGCKSDSDKYNLARVIFGEARNCSPIEQAAIAYTVINRINDGIKSNGTSFDDTLTPDKYSCLIPGSENYFATENPERVDRGSFNRCLEIADKVQKGLVRDPTNGATNYYLDGTKKPYWADETKMRKQEKRFNKMKKIGRINTESGRSKHIFFKESQW